MEVFEGKIPSNVELGQMCFSPNTIHHYDCPDYVVALLRDIARKLNIVMWNSKQKEYDNPLKIQETILCVILLKSTHIIGMKI